MKGDLHNGGMDGDISHGMEDFQLSKEPENMLYKRNPQNIKERMFFVLYLIGERICIPVHRIESIFVREKDNEAIIQIFTIDKENATMATYDLTNRERCLEYFKTNDQLK